MRNLLSKLLSTSLLLSGALGTQTVSAQDIFAQNKAETTSNVSARNTERKDAVQARKSLTVILNRFREYSVSVEAVNLDQDAINKEIAAAESAPSTSFKDYLDKMRGVLDKKLEGVSGNDEFAMFQKSRIKGGLNMLVSAKCLEGQEQNNFVQARDLDGNDLVSFPVDSLRRSTRYGTVENYREGFAKVKKDQVFGYLNLCGEEVITAQYSRAEPFNAGRAIVKRVEWYFLDAQGNESEPIAGFTDVKALSRGVSAIKMADGKFAFIDNNYDVSKKPISQSYDLIEPFFQNSVFKVRLGKKVGLLGLDGKTKLPVEYDNIEATKVAGVYKININNLVGLIDTSWTIKLQPTYTSVSDFNQFGLATAIHPKGVILVQKGTFKTTKSYETISDFNEYGVAFFRDENKKYGLIDSEMKITVEPKYFSIGKFNEHGLAAACLEANRCGFIKYDGTEQIKANYESVSDFNIFGLAVAKTTIDNCGGKAGTKCPAEVILDRNGKVIVAATEDAINNQFTYRLTDSLHSANFIIVNAQDKDSRGTNYMLIDKNTQKMITTMPYQTITSVDPNGNFRVKKNDLWGLIDTAGTTMSKCQYKEIRRVGEGYYAAQNEKGMWGFLNKKGKPQIEFEYEEVRQFRSGFAPVSKGKNKWGIISKFNAKVVPCVFKEVKMNGSETKFEVSDQEGNLYIINEKGECESNCGKFEEIRNKANKQE